MSIENNLKRIADALEMLVSKMDHIGQAVAPVEITGAIAEVIATEAPKPPAAVAPTPPQQPVAPQPVPATAPVAPAVPAAAPSPSEAPAPAAPTMTPEELNTALVGEFKRLGSREGIDKAMADLGATSVNQLAVEQYQPLLNAIKAIPA